MGVTENISRNGMLIVCDGLQPPSEMPRVGEAVVIEIELPVNHNFVQKCMHCQATVVRVSGGSGEAPRIALSINQMQFRDSTGAPPSLEELQVQLGQGPM